MIAVSACLVGIDCKYNGGNNQNEKVEVYLKDKDYIIICPEQLGGLSTPRNPAEITGNVLHETNRILDCKGKDVTKNFEKGAKESLKIARLYGCTKALLKEGSPSCGCNFIYDGTFTGKKIKGMGLTARLFVENNIDVFSEKEL